jgi:hypothetical protein
LVERDAKEAARQAEETQRRDAEVQRDRADAAERKATQQAAISQAVNKFLLTFYDAWAKPTDAALWRSKLQVAEAPTRAAENE